MVDVRLDFSFWLLKTIHCEFTTCPVFFFFFAFRVPFPLVSLPQRYAPPPYLFFSFIFFFPFTMFSPFSLNSCDSGSGGTGGEFPFSFFFFFFFFFFLLFICCEAFSDIRSFLLK